MSGAPTAAGARTGIAVIGMACRLPGAAGPDAFWRNLCAGVESIRPLSRDELLAAGADPADLDDPHHVAAGALPEGVETFDPAFFGITAREAEVMDPQHRLFLECAWEALEHAGCDPGRYEGAIGVFGGGIFDSYVTVNLMPAGVFEDKPALLQTVLANEKDYMTTRVSYKLNLRGPSYTVQSGCSTSLVAIHLACQNLLNFESDVALAGGVAIDVSRRRGYFAHAGSVHSPDGHCRAFDARAAGTVFGNGAGLVVLKRLEDAIADGDRVYAVVLGSATNNDGSLKVGFTAPSLVGQSKVIAEAMADAGVTPDTIGYVEAHGTGTALGDPIELEAMAKAFASRPVRRQSCAIGSVKTNIGHLDAAAGVSGFIKTVLALANRRIPPTLHFERPNPKVALAESPFYVADRLIEWTRGTAPGLPRRAGVSSFGMGGTNAHVVLEEAPPVAAPPPDPGPQLLVLSARSRAALDAATTNLAARLRDEPDLPLADVAHTLQTGRAVFGHRRAVVGRTPAEAAAALDAASAAGAAADTHEHDGVARGIVFLFPGQGSQAAGMGRALYDTEPAFRRHADEVFDLVRGSAGTDLRAIVFGRDAAAADRLTQTEHAQPALFAIEYALARLLLSWGIEPAASIGHSVGEYVAATLAGVFTLEDAVQLVVARGRLMQSLPPGAMTAVPRAAAALQPLLGSGLSIAAVNAPSTSVVAGPAGEVARLEDELRAAGVECRRLQTSHAFHSAMVEPILPAFREAVAARRLSPPRRPFVSNLTGRPIADAEATSPEYWVRHLRETVKFADGVRHLAQEDACHFLEVGPGRALSGLVRQQVSDRRILTLTTLAARDAEPDRAALLRTVGRLWLHGTSIDWAGLHGGAARRRVALPTYPFERARYWIDPKPPDEEKERRRRARTRAERAADWFYVPSWKQTPPAAWVAGGRPAADPARWLVFACDCALCTQVVAALARRGDEVVTVRAGSAFQGSAGAFTIDPARREDYARLVQRVGAAAGPWRIAHLWQAGAAAVPDAASAGAAQERGFYSLLWLAQALGQADAKRDAAIKVVTAGAQDVFGSGIASPEQATVAGPCLVVPQEYSQLRCQWIDLSADGAERAAAVPDLVAELIGDSSDGQVAFRAGQRWTPTFDRLAIGDNPAATLARRENGVYLVTGGLGFLGFAFAYYLASGGARLVLTTRTPLPPRDEWPGLLATLDKQDPRSARLQRLVALERTGAQVQVVAADVADPAGLRRAVHDAESRFGALHGVVAAAGVADGSAFAPVTALDRRLCDEQFRPKIGGLHALEEALDGRPLDFCIIVSSLSSFLGGPGYAAYAAANRYMDAFVSRHNRRPGAARWTAVNWDAWLRSDGRAAGSALAHLSLSPAEGLEAFTGVLSARGLGQVIVSTADLNARVFVWTTKEGSAAAPPERPTYARPAELDQSYEMPETATEETVAGIWQQVLGVDRVGVHDTFLDLGGNSLNAIQVIGRLHEQLAVRVSIEEFIFQTLRQLAAICDARLAAAGGGVRTADAVL